MSDYGHKIQVWSADWDHLNARIATLEAENARLLADVNQDEGYERLKQLLRDVRPWMGDAPYALADRIDAVLTAETPDDPTWPVSINKDAPELHCYGHSTETPVGPIAGAGEQCHLCNNIHDLMSACPPKGERKL
jgi:hypothetical protein